jgi:S-adenosyl-L-methionine hydrolase (adenosine-forming)
MKEPLITLLTDFGVADHYVAAMKGVILGICPRARLIDITHQITPFSIHEAAYTLAQAWQYFPKGTVHLAVVDPGVGSERRAMAAELNGHRFVAPDNGLLTLVLAAQHKPKIREITERLYFRKPVSNTFHGRDIFAPVAAHLASGLALARVGKPLADPIIGDFAKPTQLTETQWRGTVLSVDTFGNIITNFAWAGFHAITQRKFSLKLATKTLTKYNATYNSAATNKPFVIRGSSDYLEVSVNKINAAALLRVAPGDTAVLEWME